MTESLKFTSPAPAPVSGVLACASREAGAENNLKLARTFDIAGDVFRWACWLFIVAGFLRTLGLF